MPDITPYLNARFWSNVNKSGTCWIWTLGCFSSGYGRFTFDKKTYRAHRIAYFLTNGNIPDGYLICHKCDNPKCVNPSHLFAGTSKENTRDMIEKCRLNRSRGDSKGITYRKESKTWRVRKMVNYKNYLIGEFKYKWEAIKALHEFKNSIDIDKHV